jgi:hypothetical protein
MSVAPTFRAGESGLNPMPGWRASCRLDDEELRMASSNPTPYRQPCSLGRSFAPLDPERQREVVGYVRGGAIETVQQARGLASPASKRADWLHVQPDRDFEGSSSGRCR